ncbi:MAG: hypothetical protein QXS85_02685 [Acidilobaceae archaeon]
MSKAARALTAIFALAVVTATVWGGVFAYRWGHGVAQIAPPVVWLEDPRTPGVTVVLYDNRTSADVSVNAQYRLERVHRSAVFFDVFDDNPITAGRVTSFTCTWSWDSTRGALSIAAGSRGPSGWDYECMALANVDISAYASEGRRVYVAALAMRTSYTPYPGYTGFPRIRADGVYVDTTTTGRFYRIGYNSTLLTARTGDSLSSTILYGTTVLSHVRLGTRMTLEHEYLAQVVALVDFRAWRAEHWNVTLLSSASIGAGQRFYPNRVGVGYWISTSLFTGTFYFDNMVVTIDKPPWFVNITGLPDGWRARIVPRQGGAVVFEAVSSGGIASIPVWAPQLDLTRVTYSAGTDYGLVFRNARIEIFDDRGGLVYSALFDYVVGGDVYRFGFAGDFLHVYSNLAHAFTSRLRAAHVYCTDPRVYATISLVSWDGRKAPSDIVIANGGLQRETTGDLYISPPPSWTGSWLAVKLYLTAIAPPTASCTVRLDMDWWVMENVISSQSIVLTVRGG